MIIIVIDLQAIDASIEEDESQREIVDFCFVITTTGNNKTVTKRLRIQ